MFLAEKAVDLLLNDSEQLSLDHRLIDKRLLQRHFLADFAALVLDRQSPHDLVALEQMIIQPNFDDVADQRLLVGYSQERHEKKNKCHKFDSHFIAGMMLLLLADNLFFEKNIFF